ncbi:helix-turn-helix domain-containing protein [Chryseobacterium koreense]|uniref:winged helix-turn-helix transcriptional regulator n=1 Tax=Chryseobacterium koreense TaxID=232216 RepID=UPI0026EF11CA|nr:helix-turn-helix domain-containing protein [Chryseobacterium koreense]
MKNAKQFRSTCPLARGLDILGDKWTLLILRDIHAFGKTTYKELSQMPEKIATNTLADRLEKLTSIGLLTKTRSTKNKLVFHYHCTEKAEDLVPMIESFSKWSLKYLCEESEHADFEQVMEPVNQN